MTTIYDETVEQRTARLEKDLVDRRIKALQAELHDPAKNVAGTVSRLFAKVITQEGVEDLGLIANRRVTTAGVGWLAGLFYGGTPNTAGDLKYHQMGVGTGNETVSDVALGSAITSSRNTGTMTVGASANIFKSVATCTNVSSATVAITEHGIFYTASGNACLDRSKFASISLAPNDKIEFTYNLTFAAEASA